MRVPLAGRGGQEAHHHLDAAVAHGHTESRPDLADIAWRLEHYLGELGRRLEALPYAQHTERIHRDLARADAVTYEPLLARSLNQMGIRLSNLGRREEALAATAEAVGLYRRLAGASPAAFEPDLARSRWGG